MLVAPTDITFDSSDMKMLIIAGSVRTAPMPVRQFVFLQYEGVELLRFLWSQRLALWISSGRMVICAVIIYLWRDVVYMFWGAIDLIKRRASHNAELAFHVLIGTIPIIIVGLLLKLTHLDEHIRSATLVVINAVVFGILLYAADTYGLLRRTILDMNWKSSLIIGGAQALSLSAGTSRSGITTTAARNL